MAGWLSAFSLNHVKKAEGFLASGDQLKAAKAFARGGKHRQAARYFAEAGQDFDAVRQAFKAMLGEDAEPDPGSTLKHAGELLASAGAHAEATVLLERGGAFKLAAKSAVKAGQMAKAGALFDRVAEWTKAATCYEKAGRFQDALRVLDREVAQACSNTDARRTGYHLTRVERKRAELLAKLGRKEKAIEAMANAGSAAGSGTLLEKQGRFPEAVEAYVKAKQWEEALRVVQGRPEIEDRRAAEILMQAGRTLQAARLFASYGYTAQAAEAYEQLGKWSDAAGSWKRSKQPQKAAAAFLKAKKFREAGGCFEASRDTDGAIDAYRQAADWEKVAELEKAAGRPQDAAASYLKLRRYRQSAELLIEAGQKQAAIDVLQQCPASDHDYAASILLQASVLFELGKVEEALHRVRLLPLDTQSADSLALDRRYWESRCLESLSQLPEAISRLRDLVALAPDHRDASGRLEDLDKRISMTSEASMTGEATRVDPAAQTVTTPAAAPLNGGGQGLLEIGEILLERYEIQAELGRGGFGCVYRAFDRTLQETVAIKTLLHIGGDSIEEARLLREVRICRKITHPNIVRVHDIAHFQAGLSITMELLEGYELGDLIKRPQALTLAQIKSILAQVSAGLGEAHRLGVVHRDLKPSNIFVVGGRLKILDFGIARMDGMRTQLTQSGAAIGSPLYMSPEQLQAEKVDGRSDIYALGVIAFNLLTKHQPFSGDTITAIALAHLQQPVPDLQEYRPDLTPEWTYLVERMLAKSPDDRFQSVRDLRQQLAGLWDGKQLSDAQLGKTAQMA